jgi:hypothetical protein
VSNNNLLLFNAEPTSVSESLGTEANAHLPPESSQAPATRPTLLESSKERLENGQQATDFTPQVPQASTSLESGVSRENATLVDEDQHKGVDGADQRLGHRYDFRMLTALEEREGKGLLPGMSSFWGSLRAPIPTPSSFNTSSPEAENSCISCSAAMPLPFPREITPYDTFMSSPLSAMAASIHFLLIPSVLVASSPVD